MADRKMNSILCIQKLYFGSEIAISHLLSEGKGEVGGSRELEIRSINFHLIYLVAVVDYGMTVLLIQWTRGQSWDSV